MQDLISRREAIDAIGKASDELYENIKKGATFPQRQWFDGMAQAQSILENLPSAQPEREKGEWTKDCACEICGFKPWYERDIHTLSFCPNCGADMREDQDG